MPQVALGGVVDADEYIGRLFGMRSDERPLFVRYIDHLTNLKKVPGFLEALRDNFIGWHCHHIAGELAPLTELYEKNLYYHQPWWSLKFVREAEHRRLHKIRGQEDATLTGGIFLPTKKHLHFETI